MPPATYHVRLVVHSQDGGCHAHWIEPNGQGRDA